jgi:WD repeat-containing protein 90
MLGSYARNSSFTAVAFEQTCGAPPDPSTGQPKRRLYVASTTGQLFQFNYTDRVLECIYKLHSGPITSLSVSEGFAVTGSEDCMLRVWPLDFSEFYLQAQQKGNVSTRPRTRSPLLVLTYPALCCTRFDRRREQR